MKRVILIALALGLVTTACASGTNVGAGLENLGDNTLPPSESPSTEPTKKPPKKKSEPKTQETKEPEVKVNTIIIAVRDNFEGFEYKQPGSGWKSPPGPNAFVGDIIIFKNMDKQGNRHGWINDADESRGIKEGAVFDSGILAPGESFKWVVDAEPGLYYYSDSNVPYRTGQSGGGPLNVIERSS